MARTPLVAGNWKMSKTATEGAALARELRERLGSLDRVEVAVCPPFPALPAVGTALRGSGIALGAQDVHWEKEGAFTGAVSAGMLLDLGCRFVILGHSERRQHFGETDAAVQRKVRAALAVRLIPIVCVGETLTERDGGETLAVVARQVRAALEGLTGADLSRLVLAYEPVWAIGTGRTATPAQAQEIHGAIRRLVGQQGDGSATQILYGGSVKAENAAALLRESDIDGALVGGASLVAEQFARIVEAARPG
ncbi:MAG: triose-phosphate isomerase [candidate division NC10 bacterium]|nr:triose-phosphate isomerase [candidate division NC10 bacterium]